MKYVIFPALALALAACGAETNAPNETANLEDTYGNPASEAEAILAENEADEGSELAPADTPDHILPQAKLQAWADFVELGDFEQAASVWGASETTDARMPEQVIAARGPYSSINVEYTDSEIQGAAGSQYFETTITVDAVTEDGNPIRFEGPITLKRVNDVPGATDEELAWHYDRGSLAMVTAPVEGSK